MTPAAAVCVGGMIAGTTADGPPVDDDLNLLVVAVILAELVEQLVCERAGTTQ